MRVAVDSNIFGYAAGIGLDARKRETAGRWLKGLRAADVVMPSQVAGEFYNILVKKGGAPPVLARKIVQDWADVFGLAMPAQSTMRSALEGASFFNLQVWDALILTMAAEAGCAVLLSEDMQDGFQYSGVTVANPFAETLHPLLASLLADMPTHPGAPA